MKHLSFRTLVLCILLPPICYGITLQAFSHYLTNHLSQDIEEICVGNTTPLFQGEIRLADAVRSNIDRYLKTQRLIYWGVDVKVLVTAGNKTIIYPPVLEKERSDGHIHESSTKIAIENYSLLNEGLTVAVDVQLPLYELLPNLILFLYISVAIAILYGFYHRSVRRENFENEAINRQFNRLQAQEEEYHDRLQSLQQERASIATERDRLESMLKEEKDKAKNNESELFDEIIKLDQKLSQNLSLQDLQQAEITSLREQIDGFEKGKRKSKKTKTKELEMMAKRFRALYKNISLHDRAIEGFSNLTDDMKLKGEELIHRLNEDANQVPVKRKVFSGKGHNTVLEVLFGYNGRLYFLKTNQALEIIVIGTKNTQSKDLEYINQFSKRS